MDIIFDPGKESIMKLVITSTVLGLALITVLLTGCDALNIIKNNADLCTLINCASVGIVDFAGPHNPLVPSRPDYSKDPTCTLPGFCGANFWYPFSTATTTK
jgi:hypothetical protein